MLTGVGATIAAGSHEWNGICADLVKAPSRISTSATSTAVPGGRVGEDGAETVRAGLLAEDDQTGEHRQRAGAGHEQRLEGGGAGLRLGVGVADEQERRDRRQLPEAVEDEHVVGEDEPGHRSGEEDQQAEQADVAGDGSSK